MKEFAEKSCVIILVGNKADLESERRVQTNQGKDFAKQQGIQFFETSAITDLGINDAFMQAVESLNLP